MITFDSNSIKNISYLIRIIAAQKYYKENNNYAKIEIKKLLIKREMKTKNEIKLPDI